MQQLYNTVAHPIYFNLVSKLAGETEQAAHLPVRAELGGEVQFGDVETAVGVAKE